MDVASITSVVVRVFHTWRRGLVSYGDARGAPQDAQNVARRMHIKWGVLVTRTGTARCNGKSRWSLGMKN